MIIKGEIVYVYDIEVFPNCFHCTVKNTETGELNLFEISKRRNDIQAIVDFFWCINEDNSPKFVKKESKLICGYNCIHYDNPIINFIIENHFSAIAAKLPYRVICKKLYDLSNIIINSDDVKQWSHWKYKKYSK